MRVTLRRSEAAEAVGALLPLTQNKQVMSLNNILIRAQGDDITLTADNMETRASLRVSGIVIEDGECLISAKHLSDILRAYPHPHLFIGEGPEGNGRLARIGLDSPSYDLVTLSPDIFPERAKPDALADAEAVVLPVGYLTEAIAANGSIRPLSDEKRAYTQAIALSVAGNKIEAASSDAKRLIRYTTDVQPCADLPQLLIHKNAAAVIARLLPQGMDVTLRAAGTALHIQAEGVEIHATLLEGGFPNIQGVLDAARKVTGFLVDAETLKQVLKRALVMADAEHLSCILGFADGAMTVSVGNIDMGTFSETIPVEWGREPLEIALNPRYLLDALGACTTDKVEVKIKDAVSPALLRDVNGDGPVEAIVMPIKI